jgi:hypothetical protein
MLIKIGKFAARGLFYLVLPKPEDSINKLIKFVV